MTPNIELIVCDLDGTLLNSQHEMSQVNENALKTAIAFGVDVMLATGKTRFSARDLIERLALTTPGVYIQGLTVYTGDGAILAETTLPPELALELFRLGEEQHFIPLAYNGDRILMRHLNEEINKRFQAFHDPLPEVHPAIEELFDTLPIHKIIMMGEAHRIQGLREDLANRYQNQIQLTQSAIPEMLEILPAGASKGAGVTQALHHLKIQAEYVLAIGDGENDIELLDMAGIGVAMDNASDHVKQYADFITRSNDEDGVAFAVEHFVLKPMMATSD